MNKYTTSVSTPWKNQQDVSELISEFQSQKLRQQWFADYSFAEASSVFFCYLPDGTPCRMQGSTAIQSVDNCDVTALDLGRVYDEITKSSQSKSGRVVYLVVVADDPRQGFRIQVKGSETFEFSIRANGGGGLSNKSEIARFVDTMPVPLKVAISKKHGNDIAEVVVSSRVALGQTPLKDGCSWTREILIEYMPQPIRATIEYSFEETDVIDLSEFSTSGLGFSILDANPSEELTKWFRGDRSAVPKGRLLICNIPLKRQQEGNVISVFVDHIKDRIRLTMCAQVKHQSDLDKLANGKLRHFGFSETV